MICTGAIAIVRMLERLGVRRAFGIPGIQTIELFDALADATFETVLTTDERSAAFMADAHARATGGLGVLLVVPGPGLTNATTGLAEAMADSSAVLAIVPARDSTRRFAHGLHDIDQAGLLRPVVKRVIEIQSMTALTAAVLEAAAIAQAGEPGPVALLVPQDFFDRVAAFDLPRPKMPDAAMPDALQLDRVGEALRDAPSVGLYVGRGAAAASEEVRQLAERLNAPVATTISGRGVLPEDHPLSVGFGFGPAGQPAARRAFRRVDTLLSVGCKFTEPATGAFGFKVPPRHIHIDLNPKSIGANYPATLAVVADAREALRAVLERLGAPPAWLPAPPPARRPSLQEAAVRTGWVSCPHLLNALREVLPRDAIVTVDSGNHQFWALAEFPVYGPNTFLAPADFQAMGFSIPAAIAAARACPGRRVIALVGDGGFLLSGMELMTARRLGLSLVVLVFNDGELGLIREAQQQVHRRTPYTTITAPDLRAMADAFGMRYVRIDADPQVRPALHGALGGGALGDAVLIDARVRYDVPSRYAKGAGRATFGRMSLDRKAHLVARRLWRAARRST